MEKRALLYQQTQYTKSTYKWSTTAINYMWDLNPKMQQNNGISQSSNEL